MTARSSYSRRALLREEMCSFWAIDETLNIWWSSRRNILVLFLEMILKISQNLGEYFSAVPRLEQLCAIDRHQLFLEAKCHCRFDVMRDNLVLLEEKDKGNFVPATLIIETEWDLKTVPDKLQSDYLQAPPDNTTATIVRFLLL